MAAREIRAGKAFVELSLKNKMERDLQSAQRQLSNFAAGVAKVGAAFVGLGAAVLGPMALAVKQFITAGDQLHKMSIRTGVAVESLSELAFAARLSGSDIDALGSALFRMRRRVANAATGTGPAVRALEAMGLSAEHLTNLSTEDQFLAITDALARIENPALQAQLAFEAFGDSAKGLMPLLSEGAEGIEALRQGARDLGLIFTEEDATAAAKFGDQLEIIRLLIRGVSNQIGAALAPALSKIAEPIIKIGAAVVKLVRDNRELVIQAAKVATIVLGVGVALLAAAVAIKVTAISLALLATAIKVVAAGFGVLALAVAILKAVSVAAILVVSAVFAILNPVTLIVGAIIGLAAAAVYLSGAFTKEIAKITGALGMIPAATAEAARGMLAVLGQVLTRAGETIGIVVALIGEGQFEAAIDLLWAYVQTEFARGVAWLQKKWAEFRAGFMQIATCSLPGLPRRPGHIPAMTARG